MLLIKDFKLYLIALGLMIVAAVIYATIAKVFEVKNYHCHGKNFHLYESVNKNGNVFLKTDIMCIDIRDIKETRKWLTK